MTEANISSKGDAPKFGRPRDPSADRMILQSALEVLTDLGYAGMSVEKVAKKAGVGKTTIYRRFSSKEELAAAALESLKDEIGPLPDTGDTRNDLVEMMLQSQQVFERGPAFAMLGALLVEESRNPELFRIFRERILWVRRDEVVEVLRRGVKRGDIDANTDLEVAVEAIVGAIIAGHILGMSPSRDRADRIVDTIWTGLGR